MQENYEIWITSTLYLLHRLFLTLGWRKKRGSRLPPPVSILIPAHNASNHLENLLPQLLHQTYPAHWEVWLIDDRSTDHTPTLLEKFFHLPHFHVLTLTTMPPHHNPKKHALLHGLQKAQYEWILFLDADVQLPPSPNWLTTFMQHAQSKDALIGLSWLTAGKSLSQKFWAAEGNFLLWQAASWANWGIPYMSVGRTWACKKTYALRAIAQYLTLWSGDDDLTLQTLPPSKVGVAFSQPTWSPAPIGWEKGLLRKWRHQQTAKFYKPFLWGLLGFPSLCLAVLYAMAIHEPLFLPIALLLPALSSSLIQPQTPSPFPFLWIHQILQPFLEVVWAILSLLPRKKW
ncbi:MAG: glycosyltransferase [Bacteroidia bacterium]